MWRKSPSMLAHRALTSRMVASSATADPPTVDTPSVNPPTTIVDQAVGLPPRLAPTAAPYCAPMIDLIDNWTLLIVGCAALVLARCPRPCSWRGTRRHGGGSWWR